MQTPSSRPSVTDGARQLADAVAQSGQALNILSLFSAGWLREAAGEAPQAQAMRAALHLANASMTIVSAVRHWDPAGPDSGLTVSDATLAEWWDALHALGQVVTSEMQRRY